MIELHTRDKIYYFHSFWVMIDSAPRGPEYPDPFTVFDGLVNADDELEASQAREHLDQANAIADKAAYSNDHGVYYYGISAPYDL